jgi:hypothetical protein
MAEGFLAKGIVADASDQDNLGPQSRGGNGLVGSLTSQAQMEGVAGYRFSRCGQSRRAKGQIDVGRTNNTDSWRIGHRIAQFRLIHDPNKLKSLKIHPLLADHLQRLVGC